MIQGSQSLCISLLSLIICICKVKCRYEANWESLDKRPNPAWFDEGKFGIYIHWGVFSVPSFHADKEYCEWFGWYWQQLKEKPYVDFMRRTYPETETYTDLAPLLTGELFDANQWADIFKAAGATYIAFTSKHHEGFAMFETKYSFNWNAMVTGPKRDVLGELATAIRTRTKIHFGVYHSMFEWWNPLYDRDAANNYTTQEYIVKKLMPQMHELINKYKPDLFWNDGDWMAPYKYWNSTEFVAWLYNDSPVKDTVVTNDRWGKDARRKHGGFNTGDDHWNPRKLQTMKWEDSMFINRYSAGLCRNDPLSRYYTIEELIVILAQVVSCGGNLLMDIGITADGRILPIFEERLRQFGSWLDVNGEAIYSTKPWTYQNDTAAGNVWYTSKKSPSGGRVVYAIVLTWPRNNTLTLVTPTPTSSTTVSMIGYPGEFKWTPGAGGGGMVITFPHISYAELPCMWSWVLKIENLAKSKKPLRSYGKNLFYKRVKRV